MLQRLFWLICPLARPLLSLSHALSCLLLSNIVISVLLYNPDINDFDINDNLGRFDITKNTSCILKYQLNNMLVLPEVRHFICEKLVL